MVLSGGHDREVSAVTEGEHADLGAEQPFLEQHLGAGGPKPAIHEDVVDGVGGFLLRLGNDHALACGEPARLDDGHGIERGEMRTCGLGVGEGLGRAGRDAVLQQKRLAMRLRTLQLCGTSGRTERRDTGGLAGVDESVDEGILGTDDHEAHLVLPCGGDDALDVGGLHVQVATTRLDRSTGIARCEQDLVDLRRLCERPGEGVLSATTADDQNGVTHQSPQTEANCSFVFSVSWTKRSSSNG